jgi:hypothetical protein
MGEYARSLAIARGAVLRWPGARIHFVLSREAPYASGVPFPATLLPASPTFHSREVIALMRALEPDIIVFDNAGRTSQLRAARALGAQIVFISARSRQRRKAFRWRWMRLISEHWIAYPEFIAGSLTFVEQLKLNVLQRPVARYLDVILASGAPDGILPRLGLASGNYVLVVPGGGTGHPGARDAVAQFFAAARALAREGIATLFVGPLSAGDERDGLPPALRCLPSLPQSELAEAMRGAKLVLANGGSTLLQAIACGRACVAVSIAQDQVKRINACVSAGVAIAAELDAAGMLKQVQLLLRDESARAGLAERARGLKLADGVGIATAALARWVDT